jgi:hypothetical protein
MSDYKTQSADTTVAAEHRQIAIWRSMSDAEKLHLVGELCDSVRHLTEIGLRERYPNADEHEIRMRLFSTWLDHGAMMRCYGWDPLEH